MEKIFNKLECFFKGKMTRRKFLYFCFGGVTTLLAGNQFLKTAFAKTPEAPARKDKGMKGQYDLVEVTGKDSYQNTIKAVEAMGGMGKFVKKGDVVLVKPNIGWDRTPQQAANTDPMVVAALVEMCYQVGAKRVNVFDYPCNNEKRCYSNSGIEKAAKAKGAFVYFADHWNVVKAQFSYKSDMQNWPIFRDAIDCDTFINVPVLKHHGTTGLTISMKNLMGVCSGKRGLMHIGLAKKIVDITDFIKPDLNVVDMTRVLGRNGPSGGSVDDVKTFNKVLIATDPVLVDTYACQLVNIDPQKIEFLQEAISRNLGNADVSKANLHAIEV